MWGGKGRLGCRSDLYVLQRRVEGKDKMKQAEETEKAEREIDGVIAPKRLKHQDRS